MTTGERGRRRVAAEVGWLDLWRRRGVPVHIFRVPASAAPAAVGAGRARGRFRE